MKTIKKHIRYLFFLATLLFAGSYALCQPGLRFGAGAADIIFLKGGQTPYLGYEINSITHNFPIHSLQAGVIGQLEISNKLSFNSGILYSQQGLNYSTSYLYDDIKYRIYISYLKMPLLLKIKTNTKNSKSSGIYLGPYISGALRATKLTEIQGIRTKEEMTNVKRFDSGILFGYSWDIGQNPGQIQFDFRCSYSAVNMMHVLEGLPKFSDPEEELARNISIVLGLEYYLKSSR